jgi:hypothetical protein
MRGRHPKPAHLRQNRTVKAGRATIETPEHPEIPPIPNPDARAWHPLTLESWERAWSSPMAPEWLPSDVDAMGRLAILWDQYYKDPKVVTLAEIRQQECRFGFSPLDRSRLQWEVNRGDEAHQQRQKRLRNGAHGRVPALRMPGRVIDDSAAPATPATQLFAHRGYSLRFVRVSERCFNVARASARSTTTVFFM